MTRAFIALGSNIDPDRHVVQAVRLLAAQVRIVGISTVYRTPAEDRPEQPPYYNCVIAIETGGAPAEIQQAVLHPIEQALGRVRTADKYAARTIDLDLIWYDDLILNSAALTLPDPHIRRRVFLACGLRELAPELVWPGSGQTLAAIAAGLPAAAMEPLAAYTTLARNAAGLERDDGSA